MKTFLKKLQNRNTPGKPIIMKQIKYLFFALLAVCFLTAEAQQKSQQFGVKSGKIVYELSGNTTGTKTVYWDNYGTKTYTEVKSKSVTRFMGMTTEEEEHSITVIVADKFWAADLIDETGTSGILPYYDESVEYVENLSEAEQEELADEILRSMGGERLGTEKVNGYTCEVMSILGAKSWIYKGIVLKSEAKIMGIETNEMVTEFKPNSSVSTSQFKPYSGVSYNDMTAQGEQVEGNPFAQMAMAMEMSMEEENEEEEEIVPVGYSYEKFKTVVNDFSYSGYSFKGTNSYDGQYAAVYTKGFVNSITIMATSDENSEEDETDDFETFTHKGKTCHFGNLEDGEGTALVVEYPQHDMLIIIAGLPYMPKTELLNINDDLNF